MVPVERTAELPMGAGQAWRMLVEASFARTWWGRLDADITHVAQQLTVSTGSSSHYRVWVDTLVPGRVLEFSWAYLGVSPIRTVRIEILEARPGTVRVRVVEQLETRDAASLHQAGELWRHRLDRLVAAAGSASGSVAGIQARPDDITVRCTLDKPGWRPLHTAVLHDWLPLSGSPAAPQWFYVVDSLGPRRFPITRWLAHYDDLIVIGIQILPGVRVTRAEVSVQAEAASVELAVRHTGWSSLPLDAESREVLRDRFVATWRHALRRAGDS
jgi:uncharacterized protein YndB with AHSA1/START domain